MTINYHPGAWQCPVCDWWAATSRYKLGSHIRRCSNKKCKVRARVEIAEITKTRIYQDKVIISQPITAE